MPDLGVSLRLSLGFLRKIQVVGQNRFLEHNIIAPPPAFEKH
jgi:hypothetical protein